MTLFVHETYINVRLALRGVVFAGINGKRYVFLHANHGLLRICDFVWQGLNAQAPTLQTLLEESRPSTVAVLAPRHLALFACELNTMDHRHHLEVLHDVAIAGARVVHTTVAARINRTRARSIDKYDE